MMRWGPSIARSRRPTCRRSRRSLRRTPSRETATPPNRCGPSTASAEGPGPPRSGGGMRGLRVARGTPLRARSRVSSGNREPGVEPAEAPVEPGEPGVERRDARVEPGCRDAEAARARLVSRAVAVGAELEPGAAPAGGARSGGRSAVFAQAADVTALAVRGVPAVDRGSRAGADGRAR